MKATHTVSLLGLLALSVPMARSQSVDRAGSLPVAMQAQIGNTVEIHCIGPTVIPFTPASGSTKELKCGDSVTVAAVHGDSYLVRTENGSTGYVEVALLPTDPCVQTRYRSALLRKQWAPKIATMSKDEFWKLKNELYLKVTPEDISAAYGCLRVAVDEEQSLGGMAGYANTVAFDLSAGGRPPGPDLKNKLVKFAQTLDDQITALALLDDTSAAQTFVYSTRHDDIVNRYNSLVDKHDNFIDFVSQRLHQLDAAAPPAAPGDTTGWRSILDGTIQSLAGFTPPKHLACGTKGETSPFGDPVQPSFIYLNATTECQEK